MEKLISLLDLTSLNDNDTEDSIRKLCTAATTSYGNVAAVCVYPQFVALAKDLLKDTNINIATVVNFPSGDATAEQADAETLNAINAGANEIDVVLPYKALLAGDRTTALSLLRTVKERCEQHGATVKVIVETGAFPNTDTIKNGAEVALLGGAYFLKTSTGKIATGATPEAVRAFCEVIRDQNIAETVGIKISGGVRTVADANQYLDIIQEHFGEEWITPAHVRIGASSLLNDILAHLTENHK